MKAIEILLRYWKKIHFSCDAAIACHVSIMSKCRCSLKRVAWCMELSVADANLKLRFNHEAKRFTFCFGNEKQSPKLCTSLSLTKQWLANKCKNTISIFKIANTFSSTPEKFLKTMDKVKKGVYLISDQQILTVQIVWIGQALNKLQFNLKS